MGNIEEHFFHGNVPLLLRHPVVTDKLGGRKGERIAAEYGLASASSFRYTPHEIFSLPATSFFLSQLIAIFTFSIMKYFRFRASIECFEVTGFTKPLLGQPHGPQPENGGISISANDHIGRNTVRRCYWILNLRVINDETPPVWLAESTSRPTG